MITIPISDRLASALCDTLLHSLWQGVLLAAVAGLTVICTRKAGSALRYNLLVSALVLFVLGASATFALQFRKAGNAVPVMPLAAPVYFVKTGTAGPEITPAASPLPRFTDRVSAFLNDHHNTIALVWFLIICARSLQLGAGLYGTFRLKRVRVSPVKDHWPERMQQLADALDIRQSIILLESGLAKAPMMIGYLKPVVLVPLGLLTALSPAEVEAILIHELAHIKRRDYLANLLQNIIEIFFFFNPAVMWVSALIRTERENCCDDLALAHDNNKATYIRALVSCEEYQASAPPFALAFPGAGNTLLHRVRRLVSNRNHSLNLFEKTVLTICLVVAGLFVTAFSVKKSAPAHPVSKISPSVHHLNTSIAAYSHSAVVASVPKSAHTAEPNYQIQNPKHADPPATQPTQPADSVAQPNHDTTGHPTIPDLGDTLVKYNIIKAKFNMTAKLNSSELSINGVKQPEAIRSLIYSKFLNNDGHSVNIDYVYKDAQPEAYNAPYGETGSESNYERERETLIREQEALDRKQEALARERTYLDRQKNYSYQRQQYKSDEATIKLDLMKEGLVSDTNHIHFTINEKEFILNGVKQSPEVHQQYLSKYCPAKGAAGWSWSHSTNRP